MARARDYSSHSILFFPTSDPPSLCFLTMIPAESSSDELVSKEVDILLHRPESPPLMGSQSFLPLESIFAENNEFSGPFSELELFSPPLEPFEFKPSLIKEEASIPIACPQPLECLQESPVPPFLSKTFDLVDDPSLDPIISWSSDGQSFVVWDCMEFARLILPSNFKHNNFSSFVRQLNTYVGTSAWYPSKIALIGFRKIDTDRWEFSNEAFQRGRRQLLKNIQRRKPHPHQISFPSPASCEAEKSETRCEIEKLKSEKRSLMAEVVELQEQHRETSMHASLVNGRLESAEKREKQMVSFLAKLVRNPPFLSWLEHNKENRQIGSSKAKRKYVEQITQKDSSDENQIVMYNSERSTDPLLSISPEFDKFESVIGIGSSDESCRGFVAKIGEKPEEKGEKVGSSLRMEDEKCKGKMRMIPEEEQKSDYYASFPGEGISAFSVFGDESMVRQEDLWGNALNFEEPEFPQLWSLASRAIDWPFHQCEFDKTVDQSGYPDDHKYW